MSEDVGHGGGELVDVPVGVDVAGGLDGGVAEQLLNSLEVACLVEHALTGGVPGLVHPLAAGRPFRDHAGVFEALVPPVMEAVVAHSLSGKRTTPARGTVFWRHIRKWFGCASTSMTCRSRSVQNAGWGMGTSRTFWPLVKMVSRRRW